MHLRQPEWRARNTDEHDTALSSAELFRLEVLLVLALATSIDALAVDVTLPMLGAPLGSQRLLRNAASRRLALQRSSALASATPTLKCVSLRLAW